MRKKLAPTELIPVPINNACSAVLADVTDLGDSEPVKEIEFRDPVWTVDWN